MANNMDAAIPGYGRMKAVTKNDMARLKRGGEKADKIKEQKEKHHREKEIPEAERLLEEELKKLNRL